MRSTFSTLGLLASFAVAYDCSVSAIAALLPAKSIVFYATHFDAGAIFTPPPEYNAGGGPPGAPPGVLPVDNGEFFGSVSWDSVIDGMWYGFASVSTNTGHESGGADWAYNNPEALENCGYRVMHDTVLKGKAVTQGYYGINISYSYYRGCTAGGKQGLKGVEIFPNDFDGVVAGAPAWWTTHLQLWNMIVGIWNQPANSSQYVPPSISTYLADEVIGQCDAQDGVTDGIVIDPLACKFNASRLLCPPGVANTATCLNSEQIATFNKPHSDWIEADSSYSLPSHWAYMLSLGPDWTWEDWNPAIILLLDLINPGHATANNFNLAPFHKISCGKLLHYHGLLDAFIATGSSIRFYDQVAKALKPQCIKLDGFYKFYLVPGMGHCAMTYPKMNAPWVIDGDGQAGGLARTSHGVPGFQDAKHDVLLAVMAWVENGTVLTDIIATKYANDTNPDGGVLRQRPLRAYPSKTVYDGTGDLNIATMPYCPLNVSELPLKTLEPSPRVVDVKKYMESRPDVYLARKTMAPLDAVVTFLWLKDPRYLQQFLNRRCPLFICQIKWKDPDVERTAWEITVMRQKMSESLHTIELRAVIPMRMEDEKMIFRTIELHYITDGHILRFEYHDENSSDLWQAPEIYATKKTSTATLANLSQSEKVLLFFTMILIELECHTLVNPQICLGNEAPEYYFVFDGKWKRPEDLVICPRLREKYRDDEEMSQNLRYTNATFMASLYMPSAGYQNCRGFDGERECENKDGTLLQA
ncbi:putative feruloyl esterase b precursor protein [Botrytis fragariae]|uniref:Carboxylic ester hydrolase n=1 Tax=Botrytis fragariae TaxID=1964551 RepID=A0A8H6AJF3_9HELO|nr:putative feruloyl esterase b precursor protein [Botrytis fragariae]KAF5868762.1 putative feruloyl esterase b precursor protein [Botrytis fragariae]